MPEFYHAASPIPPAPILFVNGVKAREAATFGAGDTAANYAAAMLCQCRGYGNLALDFALQALDRNLDANALAPEAAAFLRDAEVELRPGITIFIATPAIVIYGNHFAAIVKAIPRLLGAGIAVDHYLFTNNAHIDDARNACVAAFLKSKADYLVFIDADVGFPPEALYRLCMHDGDIVAGVYPHKNVGPRTYPMRFEGDVLKAGDDGLIREHILSVPTGFLRLSRKLLEHMAEHFLAKGYKSPETAGEVVPCLFERRTIHGERYSGDVAFCVAARELGYPIFVDPMLALSHAGEVRFQGMLAADYAEPANQTEESNGVQ